MSGYKESSYSFRNQVRDAINNYHQTISSLDICGAIMTGIKSTVKEFFLFPADSRTAEKINEWTRKQEQIKSSISGSYYASQETVYNSSQLVDEGRRLYKEILAMKSMIKNKKRLLDSKIGEIEAKLEANKEIIDKYVDQKDRNDVTSQLEKFKESIKKEDITKAELDSAEKGINALEEKTDKLIKMAQKREDEFIQKETVKRFTNVKKELDSIDYSLRYTIKSITEGIKEVINEEVNIAKEWLNQKMTCLKISENKNVTDNIVSELNEMLKKGEDIKRNLEKALEKASNLKDEIENDVSSIEVFFNGNKNLITSWLGREEVDKLENILEGLKIKVDKGYLRDIKGQIEELKKEIEDKANKARDLETKNQKRLYLLKALRQVCADMGFSEKMPPKYEKENDRSSRIILTVDTHNQGLITFYLTLDSISADSEIADNYCFEEFDKLSANLVEKFGIQTKFRRPQEEPKPKRIRKGELEEPDSSGKAREA